MTLTSSLQHVSDRRGDPTDANALDIVGSLFPVDELRGMSTAEGRFSDLISLMACLLTSRRSAAIELDRHVKPA